MRNAHGYATVTCRDTGKVLEEQDTVTCGHCNHIVFLGATQDPAQAGGFCRMCMTNVCARCAAGGCVPFERKLEAYERRDRLLRAVLE